MSTALNWEPHQLAWEVYIKLRGEICGVECVPSALMAPYPLFRRRRWKKRRRRRNVRSESTAANWGGGKRNERDVKSNRRESASSELMNILVTVC